MQHQFRKVEEWKGFVLNFEKSKSRKVRGKKKNRKVEKSKSILFDFSLFDFLFFLPDAFSAVYAQLQVQN